MTSDRREPVERPKGERARLPPSIKSLRAQPASRTIMLEILILLGTMLAIALAKHKPQRKRRFTMRKVRVTGSLSLGALAALDVVSGAITDASTDPYRLISANLRYTLVNLGAVIDDGQEFGLAHSDYTAAEIEECLEATASIDLGDKIAQEQANRLVRSIGIMTGGNAAAGNMDFNDGRPVKTRLNWKMSTGDTLNIWVRNSSGVVYTTGATVSTLGEIWIVDS